MGSHPRRDTVPFEEPWSNPEGMFIGGSSSRSRRPAADLAAVRWVLSLSLIGSGVDPWRMERFVPTTGWRCGSMTCANGYVTRYGVPIRNRCLFP